MPARSTSASTPAVTAEQLTSQALMLHQAGRLDEACSHYAKVLTLTPEHPLALTNLGSISFSQGHYEQALQFFTAALRAEPKYASALYNMARTFQELQQWDKAAARYRACLKQNAEHRESLENLIAVLLIQGDYPAALQYAQKRVRVAKDVQALRLLGHTCLENGNADAGLQAYEHALELSPADPEVRYDLALTALNNQNFESGWPLFHHRWSVTEFLQSNPPATLPVPRWNGEPLAGKHLCIASEQGLGDELMYASCLPDLVRANARVTMTCDVRLLDTFQRSFPEVEFLPKCSASALTALPWLNIDYSCPLATLPAYLRTSLADFSGQPWLSPDTDLRRSWSEHLTRYPGLKVGLSWQGGALPRDKMKRSIALPQLLGALNTSGVSLVSLQYAPDTKAIVQANRKATQKLQVMEDLDCKNDLQSLCALIASLDLVITVDNTTAHLAGALGKPVWLLLPASSEWRWSHSGTESYWYPSMRIFRNKTTRDWRALTKEIRGSLNKLVENESTPTELIQPALPQNEDSNSECYKRAYQHTAPPNNEACGPVPTSHPNDSQYPQPNAAATAASPSTPIQESVLLLNDTLNWYHWGCSCTSLGLFNQLHRHGAQVASLPIASILEVSVFPQSAEQFESQPLLDAFVSRYPEIIKALEECDRVVINGEGTLHDTTQASLTLLYIAYVAKRVMGKRVELINHSCFPDDRTVPESPVKVALYQQVYQILDHVAVRDTFSQTICQNMGVNATLAFDCLPLALRDVFPDTIPANPSQRITIGASALLDKRFQPFIKQILEDTSLRKLYQFDLLLGSRARMSAEDVKFAQKLSKANNPLHLVFARSEAEWLHQINTSNVLVSGRFHHSVAAACLQTPFLLFGSNTPKNAALSARLGGYPGDLLDTTQDPRAVLCDALANPAEFQLSEGAIQSLSKAAELNFSTSA